MPTAARVLVSPSERRRHERDEAQARDFLLHLERQAREILGLAASTEFDTSVQSFAHYRRFRRKVEEFESLCSVIAGQLRKVIGGERGVLNELFHARRDMILGPSIRAMTAFFTRLRDGGVMPFGLHDVLTAEVRALETMREILAGAGSAAADDSETLAQIDRLEALIESLQGKVTEFANFDTTEAVAALLPPEEEPIEARDRAADTDATDTRDTPELRAVREVRATLEPCRKDYALANHAEIDLRALDDIERRLTADAGDRGAAKWLKHLCTAWGTRLRKKAHLFNKILGEIS